MKTHVLFDLSRLLWRAERFAPTGIDRVELAYARHLIATARDRLSFTGWWGRLGLLPDEPAVALVEALDALWSGKFIDRAAHKRTATIARRLRLHVLLHGEGPLYAHARRIGNPIVYLLVSHHRLDRPAALGRFKARTGARFVCLVHDLIPIEYPEYVRWGHARRHHQRIETVARLADAVIANSAGTAAALQRHLQHLGRVAPVLVAPLGVDVRPTAPRNSAPADHPYFICVGTIEPRKNHLLLLDVWRHLGTELGARAPRLLLVGRRGWRSRKVAAVIERSTPIRGLVEQYTALPDAAVADLLVGARALLYPSFAEGYGLPVAEALALGVPVLCSDLPELREVGRKVPEYLDPLDGTAWRDVILDYARTGSSGRRAQLTRLSDWRPPSWEDHFATVRPLLEDHDPAARNGCP